MNTLSVTLVAPSMKRSKMISFVIFQSSRRSVFFLCVVNRVLTCEALHIIFFIHIVVSSISYNFFKVYKLNNKKFIF
jgi:hypothetical protein